jgi:hypothetical protein
MVALALVAVGTAWAYWTTQGSGSATAAVGTLNEPTNVTASTTPGSDTVSVSWTGSTLSNGSDPDGYYVTRINAANSQMTAACDSSPTALVSGTSCSDTIVPDGSYRYTVTAVYRTWTATSAQSNEVTVQGDNTAPSIAVTFPADGATYAAAAWNAGCSPTAGICGTASDSGGVVSVEVSILEQSSGKYWNGASFVATSEVFNTATGTTAWHYPLTLPPDGDYTVRVRATDGHGNTTAAANYVTRSFTIDATAPTATVAAASSSPTNTQPIDYDVTFSEPVSDLTAADVTITAPAANTGLAKSVSKTDSEHFTISISGLETNGTGDGSVSVQVNAGAVSDAVGNANTASNTEAVIWDRTAPSRTGLEFFDTDSNGKVDRVKATYDESLGVYSAGTSPWTLSNVPSGGSLASVSVAGSVVTLDLDEGADAASTAVGSFTVSYAAPASGGIGDAAGNVATSFGATTPTDRSAPALTLLRMLDNDTDGKVDRVTATFSETLAAYSAGNSPWTLTNVPSGGSLSSVSVSGAVATLTITEGAGAANTAVGSFTVALAQASNGIRDAVSNFGSFTARAPTDGAGPVPTALTDTNGANDGRFQQNDTMTVTFSENVASVPASSTVTLTGGNGGNNDTIAMTNLLSGTVSLGRSDYISGNGSVATFNSALGKPAQNQVTLTLGSCSGACASLTTAGGSGSFTFTPASGILDAPVLNAATGSLTVSIRLF